MYGDGFSEISQQAANLNIDDGPANPEAFAAFDSEPPPAPELHSKGVIAMDITEQFTDAADQLATGDLVKDPHFTLFEAVGALEIMDPKMDSGYLEPGESMEDDYDFSQALLPEEIIGIIDQLLCHEMAWQMGYPLSQTIFTSLYIDRILTPCPLSIGHTYFDRSESCSNDEPLTLQILRAYCLGLIKTCCFVNNRVKTEHYYEEEDFVAHTYNRSLLESIDHTEILGFIESTTELLSNNHDMPINLRLALVSCLTFRAYFLKTVEMADSRTSNELKALWTQLGTFSADLRTSIKLGKSVPKSFSVKIQRKLASTVPPRPIVEVSQEAAFNHLERLCRDGSIVVEVLQYHDSHSLMTFVSLFQARKPQPSVYIRTLLQHYLFCDMIVLGKMSIRQVLDEDLSSTVLPGNVLLDRDNDEIEIPTDPRHNMANQMEVFRSRAASSYLDILRTICQNRCRIRRTLCHTITDWDNLQLDAEELDLRLREFTKEEPAIDANVSDEPIYSFPLSSWAYLYKLRQMEWIVQMGFELETYQPDEIATMYWYLHYLSKTRVRHLQRIRGFMLRGHQKALSKAQGFLPDLEQEQYDKSHSFIKFSTLEATTASEFAESLSCLYTALARHTLLPELPRPYGDETTRYEVRMKPFLAIGLPELVPLDELSQSVLQPNETTSSLLEIAEMCLLGAKKGFDMISKYSAEEAFCQGSHESWLKNIKDCQKAVILAGITISAVKKAVGAEARGGKLSMKVEIPPPGKGYHDWWVVPKAVPIVGYQPPTPMTAFPRKLGQHPK